MARPLPFDHLARRVLKTDADGVARLDVAALARELRVYDRVVQERLRRAALRAIDVEVARIQAERQTDPPC